MGTGSSALLAHLAGVCISGHVTGALLGGHGVRRAAGSQGWRSARGPAPYWAQAGARAALRLLHQARGSAWGGWRMGAALGPSEHKGLMSNASRNPHHQKHNCLSGSSPSASWFISILPLSSPHQKQQGLGRAPPSPPVEQNSVSPALLGGTELALAAISKDDSVLSPSQLLFSLGLAFQQFTKCLRIWYCLVDALSWPPLQKKSLQLVLSLTVSQNIKKLCIKLYICCYLK